MNKRKKKYWNRLSILAAMACILCFGFVAWHYWENFRSSRDYHELRQQVSKDNESESEEKSEVSQTLDEIESAEFVGYIDAPAPEIPEEVLLDAEENPIDFKKLQEINSELYAWIRIPNTAIDYPIAQRQGEEQDFYLHHDMYQNPQFAGCIYTESVNSLDFTDPVTVLYGHNMKNGSMFQNLFYFLEQDFFDDNKYVYIYTPAETLVYEIVSAYQYDDRNIMTSFDFSDTDDLNDYLEACQRPRSMEAMVRDDIELTEDSKMLTLSTCIANQTDQRLLVQAVLIHEENEK